VHARAPEVEILALPRNLGYARANNLGIVYALKHGGEYIVLLNNDIEVVDPYWLNLAVKVMERRRDIGILGFNLILPSGQSQYSSKLRPQEVGEVVFAAAIIRSGVFKATGFLDDEYVIGGAEDLDFCYRARRCGFKIVYIPCVKMLHMHRATFKRIPHNIAFILGSRNRFRHFILNKPLHELFIWIVGAFVGIKNGKFVLRNDVKRFKWLTYGFVVSVKWDGFTGLARLIAERLRRSFIMC
jgi:GT2 family glycosyltransferase